MKLSSWLSCINSTNYGFISQGIKLNTSATPLVLNDWKHIDIVLYMYLSDIFMIEVRQILISKLNMKRHLHLQGEYILGTAYW